MRRVIITATIGSHLPLWDLTIPTQKKYAQKLRVRHLTLKSNLTSLEGAAAQWGKFWIYYILGGLGENKYKIPIRVEEILWLDADVIVNPKAPDIFEAAGGKFAAFPEGDVVERSINFMDYCSFLRKTIPDKNQIKYYNTGIMVVPKKDKEIFAIPSNEEIEKTMKLRQLDPGRFYRDQNLLNLRLMEQKTDVKSLPIEWNVMHVPTENAGRDWNKRTEFAHMIHYAGLNDCMGKDLLPLIKDDIRKWGIYNG